MMKLYENIKKRRLELHMSQQTLAELTGYADKSMIAKIEKGQVDLPQSKLEIFAKVLGVKPGELLGTTEEDPNITQEEYYTNLEVAELAQQLKDRPELKVLFDASRDISKEDVQFVIDMIERMK